MNKEEILDAIKAGNIADYTDRKSKNLGAEEEKEFFLEFAELVSSLRAHDKIESYYTSIDDRGVKRINAGDLKAIKD
tara:strand:+ start:256 stop:486 length:231 start_codon:yes stop_codon:yes gene_type:complete